MIYSNNIASVTGFMAFDVDLVDTQNSKIAKFKIHVKERVMKSDKSVTNVSHWIECKAWGKTGEAIANNCAKGDFVQVLGKNVTESWEDRDSGKKRSKQLLEIQDFKNYTKMFNAIGGPKPADPDEDISFSQGSSGFGGESGLPPAFGDVPKFGNEDNGGLY